MPNMNSWNHDIIMTLKMKDSTLDQFAHLKKIDLNRFLGYARIKCLMHETLFKNEHIDSTLTLSFSTSLAYPLIMMSWFEEFIRHF